MQKSVPRRRRSLRAHRLGQQPRHGAMSSSAQPSRLRLRSWHNPSSSAPRHNQAPARSPRGAPADYALAWFPPARCRPGGDKEIVDEAVPAGHLPYHRDGCAKARFNLRDGEDFRMVVDQLLQPRLLEPTRRSEFDRLQLVARSIRPEQEGRAKCLAGGQGDHLSHRTRALLREAARSGSGHPLLPPDVRLISLVNSSLTVRLLSTISNGHTRSQPKGSQGKCH